MPTLVLETAVLKPTVSGSKRTQLLTSFKTIILLGHFPMQYIFFAHGGQSTAIYNQCQEQHSKKGLVTSKPSQDQFRFSTAIIHILNLITQVDGGSLL